MAAIDWYKANAHHWIIDNKYSSLTLAQIEEITAKEFDWHSSTISAVKVQFSDGTELLGIEAAANHHHAFTEEEYERLINVLDQALRDIVK